MLERLRSEILFGAMLATAVWAVVLGWQASYEPTEHEKQECQDAAKKAGHKTEECKTLWEKTTTDPVALFTFVLAVSTISLWGVTWLAGKRQSREMQQSLQIARDEFNATHRPKIIVRTIEGPFDDGQSPQFVWVTLANVGETPATIVAMGTDLARRIGRGGWLPPGVGAGLRQVTPLTLESGERLTLTVRAQIITSTARVNSMTNADRSRDSERPQKDRRHPVTPHGVNIAPNHINLDAPDAVNYQSDDPPNHFVSPVSNFAAATFSPLTPLPWHTQHSTFGIGLFCTANSKS